LYVKKIHVVVLNADAVPVAGINYKSISSESNL